MYHKLRFNDDLTVDLEVSARQPLERLHVRKGQLVRAQVKPYVLETPAGPVEVADLYLSDGTTARAVPFERFWFVD